MKFTQSEAAKKISGILTRGGKDQQLSDRTIAENLDSLMKVMVNDETELDDFVKQVEPLFKTWQANAKKDTSDFIDKWKEKYGEPTNPPTDPEPPKPTEDPALKAYEERIAALEKKLAEADTKSVLAQKRKDLTDKLKEKGVKDDEWLNDLLSEVNITAETDIDAKAESYVKLYNKSKAKGGNPVPPANPNGGGTDDAWLKSIDAAVELDKGERAVIETNNK